MTRSFALFAAAGLLAAQNPLTLEQAVGAAVARYPAVEVSREQAAAAAAAVNLARTAWLPRADFLGQVNRATHNNVFGMLLAQSVISPISGPVLRTNSAASVWGSAVGVLVSWEPFDFGLRQANLGAAAATRDRAGAAIAVTRLQVAAAAADAFLTLLAAEQTVRAAQAGVERARVVHGVVASLAKNQLRPGADESRARAEMALAETRSIQAGQAVETARAALSPLVGVPAAQIRIAPGPLLGLPAQPFTPPPPDAAGHPLAVAQNAAIEEVKAREKALDRTYYPRFNLEATAYARGTGVQPDGTTGNAASGLGPNIHNWGLGFSVQWDPLDIAALRARKAIAAAEERAEAARYRKVMEDLAGERARAEALLAGARRIAETTPVQLAAARDTAGQAEARYKAGLTGVVEVAEAERLLTEAEIEDSLARLSVWRAALAAAAAAGDLTPYLSVAGK